MAPGQKRLNKVYSFNSSLKKSVTKTVKWLCNYEESKTKHHYINLPNKHILHNCIFFFPFTENVFPPFFFPVEPPTCHLDNALNLKREMWTMYRSCSITNTFYISLLYFIFLNVNFRLE